MKPIRLLPIVVFATFALLVLKSVGLITQGGYVLLGTDLARAQEQAGEVSPEDARAAERANEALFPEGQEGPTNMGEDAVATAKNSKGDIREVGSSDGLDQSERAVLQRLSGRRAELDTLASNLDARTALVEAAERRLAERIAGLEAIEGRISALVEEKKGLDDAQFAGIVGMYETMKPGDAAAIFDDLQMDVLLRVARNMNPRKMSPVLAKMNKARARELTMNMAAYQAEPALDEPIDSLDDLPEIVGN